MQLIINCLLDSTRLSVIYFRRSSEQSELELIVTVLYAVSPYKISSIMNLILKIFFFFDKEIKK